MKFALFGGALKAFCYFATAKHKFEKLQPSVAFGPFSRQRRRMFETVLPVHSIKSLLVFSHLQQYLWTLLKIWGLTSPLDMSVCAWMWELPSSREPKTHLWNPC